MKQTSQLKLERCPNCSIAQPLMNGIWSTETNDFNQRNKRRWAAYACGTCGGVMLTVSPSAQQLLDITQMWPAPQAVAEELPERAKEYLSQAISSIHAPVGAVVTAASAVDAMLKSKGFKDGSLYSRIDAAAEAHLITQEMAEWAHEIRLEANSQRHADESMALPTSSDANKVIEFATALGQFLFVLPSRVERGRQAKG